MNPNDTLPFYIGLPLTFAFIYGGICLLWGFFASVSQMFSIPERLAARKRENGPDNIADGIAREILSQLVAKTGWTTCVESDRSWRTGSGEQLKRDDGKICIAHYNSEGETFEVDIEGVGKFSSDQFKPSLARELRSACKAFQQLVAVHQVVHRD